MKTLSKKWLPLIFLTLFLLGGCAKPKPFVYHPATEIPEGPGLFSKDKGEFVLYDSEKTAGGDASAPSAKGADTDEFRDFQQWQKSREEFRAFQEWKRSEENAGEYQEFLEWKRWKAYKEWQENQRKQD